MRNADYRRQNNKNMKELDYFCIDDSIGWNQNNFSDWSMYDGGCAAVTACDLCIYLAQQKGFADLYPYDSRYPTQKEYLAFSETMKQYLHPRWQGIDTLELYLSGILSYFQDRGVSSISGKGISGSLPVHRARDLIRKQIDSEFLVPCLLLYHKNSMLKDFQWHWFNLAGYEEFEDEFYVKAVTYGNFYWLNLRELWNTGYRRKGGLIEIKT